MPFDLKYIVNVSLKYIVNVSPFIFRLKVSHELQWILSMKLDEMDWFLTDFEAVRCD